MKRINLSNSPEAGDRLLILLPDIRILDGEDDEAVGVLAQKWLVLDIELDFIRGEHWRLNTALVSLTLE